MKPQKNVIENFGIISYFEQNRIASNQITIFLKVQGTKKGSLVPLLVPCICN